jgi:hypothetical protein
MRENVVDERVKDFALSFDVDLDEVVPNVADETGDVVV